MTGGSIDAAQTWLGAGTSLEARPAPGTAGRGRLYCCDIPFADLKLVFRVAAVLKATPGLDFM